MSEESKTSWTADDWIREGLRLVRDRNYEAAYRAYETAPSLRPGALDGAWKRRVG